MASAASILKVAAKSEPLQLRLRTPTALQTKNFVRRIECRAWHRLAEVEVWTNFSKGRYRQLMSAFQSREGELKLGTLDVARCMMH